MFQIFNSPPVPSVTKSWASRGGTPAFLRLWGYWRRDVLVAYSYGSYSWRQNHDYEMRMRSSMKCVTSTAEASSHHVHKTNTVKVDGLMLLLFPSMKTQHDQKTRNLLKHYNAHLANSGLPQQRICAVILGFGGSTWLNYAETFCAHLPSGIML